LCQGTFLINLSWCEKYSAKGKVDSRKTSAFEMNPAITATAKKFFFFLQTTHEQAPNPRKKTVKVEILI